MLKLDTNKLIRQALGDFVDPKTANKIQRYADLYDELTGVGYNVEEPEQNTDKISRLIALEVASRALRYTPIDTGRLRKSLYVRGYKGGMVVGYSAPYAIYVHEIAENAHSFPTKYKFLEDAAIEVISQYDNLPVEIRIEYKPLRVFIGRNISNGESLVVSYNWNKTIRTMIQTYLNSGR